MFKSTLTLSFFLMTVYLQIGQAQVYSTLQGGPWDQPSTWVDGVVPAPGDDVVLTGPVTVEGLTFCHNLTIEPGGSLMAQSNIQPYMFTASGTIWNKGKIDGDNSLFPLAFTVGGDLFNEGTWKSFQIVFSDTLTHILRAEPGSLFSPTFVYADSAHIISDRDAYLDNVEFRAQKLELQVDHVTQQPTTFHFLNNSIFRVDEIIGQDNAVAGDSGSYIWTPINVSVPVFRDIHIGGETVLNWNIMVEGNIVIDDTLRLIDNFTNTRSVSVSGNIENNGAVLPNNLGYGLTWDCDGNVTNSGVWESNVLTFTGTGSYYLFTDLTSTFNPSAIQALSCTIVSDSSLRFDDVTIQIRKLILQPNHDLFLQLHSILRVDTLIGNHNRLHCNDSSELWWTASGSGTPVYENILLDGTARVNSNLTFEGSLVVEGAMQILDGITNNKTITVNGNIENTGSITFNNINYGLMFTIAGNLENRGQWQSAAVTMSGTGTHHLFTDPGQSFNPVGFYAVNSTVMSDTTLRFDDVTIQIKKLFLQPGHDLMLQQHSILRVDTLIGNYNRLHCNDTSELWWTASGSGTPVYENIILDGTARVNSNLTFDGSLMVEGTLQMLDGSTTNRTIFVNGDLMNTGTIQPNNLGYLLFFTVEGNLENAGQWESGVVELKGTTTQQAAIPDSAAFLADLKLYAMHTGNQYQWMRDGAPLTNGSNISGATTAILTLSSVTPADFGTYQCEIDSNGVTIFSREIIINDVITGIPPDKQPINEGRVIPKSFSLGQNYPNPFNPSTTIVYQLPHRTHVRLTVYDLLGRNIMTLVNREQTAGEYSVKLNGVNIPSGVYVYRLEAGSFIQTRKMTLLK